MIAAVTGTEKPVRTEKIAKLESKTPSLALSYMYSRQGTTNINNIFHKLVQEHGVPKDVRCKKIELKASSM